MTDSNWEDLKFLISKFNCDDTIRCQNARRALVALGRTAVPALIEALHGSEKMVRWEAAKALSQIGAPEATSALIQALQDRDYEIRWLAAEGLVSIGKPALPPLLEALVDNSKSKLLREGAHHVLHDAKLGNWAEILAPVKRSLESGASRAETPVTAQRALNSLAH